MVSGKISSDQLDYAVNKKYKGLWYHQCLLYIYVVGRKIGYSFDKQFLTLVEFATYQGLSYAALFEKKYADQYVKNMKKVQRALNSKAKTVNLYSIL